jgi:PIN domain nuclease of toxin-antitoxin system
MGINNGWLLDTHALLWWMLEAKELPKKIAQGIRNPEQDIFISAAVVWEIGIKQRIGKIQGVEDYLANPTIFHRRWGFRDLSIDHDDARLAAMFAWDHRDPFDRMLVAQSRRHQLILISSDPKIKEYHPETHW